MRSFLLFTSFGVKSASDCPRRLRPWLVPHVPLSSFWLWTKSRLRLSPCFCGASVFLIPRISFLTVFFSLSLRHRCNADRDTSRRLYGDIIRLEMWLTFYWWKGTRESLLTATPDLPLPLNPRGASRAARFNDYLLRRFLQMKINASIRSNQVKYQQKM